MTEQELKSFEDSVIGRFDGMKEVIKRRHICESLIVELQKRNGDIAEVNSMQFKCIQQQNDKITKLEKNLNDIQTQWLVCKNKLHEMGVNI